MNNNTQIPHGALSDLAREAQVTPGFVSNLVKGRRHAKLDVARRLAAVTKSKVRAWREDGPVTERAEAVAAWATNKEQA